MEVWSREFSTNSDGLHIFGCLAYFHVKEDKLDLIAKKAIFVGFSIGVKAYKLWCPKLKKLLTIVMFHLMSM